MWRRRRVKNTSAPGSFLFRCPRTPEPHSSQEKHCRLLSWGSPKTGQLTFAEEGADHEAEGDGGDGKAGQEDQQQRGVAVRQHGYVLLHLRGRGSFDLDGTRYGVLICYEQLMFWLVVQTFAEKPGVVLAPANSWWSKNTSIPDIQKSVMATWARLFDVPVATSHNF